MLNHSSHIIPKKRLHLQLPDLLQEAECGDAVSGVSSQGHSFEQAAQSLGQRVHGEGRRDGVKVLLQVCHALIVDLSHVVCGPCLLLLTRTEGRRINDK